MEKITTDISTFANLRKDGYTYVDKTDLMWRLVANVDAYKGDRRPVTLAGVNFRTAKRNIDEPVMGGF